MLIYKIIIALILPIYTIQFRTNNNSLNNISYRCSTHCLNSINNSNLSQKKFTVGIEAHIQLSLLNKLFCNCKTNFTYNHLLFKIKHNLIYLKTTSIDDDSIDFHRYFINNYEDFSTNINRNEIVEAQPNENACHVCRGEPGSYGRLNPYAVPMALLASRLLGCNYIADEIIFHRKIYEYIDLPKQFQLSQCNSPMAKNGVINVPNYGKISVKQIHLEEDTAKRINSNDNLDYNRSGICLLELVTDTIECTSDELVSICKEIQRLFKISKLSECEMHRGNLRFDINISSPDLNNIIEVKNLNSFERIKLSLNKALEYGNKNLEKYENNEIPTKEMDELISYSTKHSPINTTEKKSVTALYNGKDSFNLTRPKSNYLYVRDWTIYPIKLNPLVVNSISKLIQPERYIDRLDKIYIPFDKYPDVSPNLLSHICKDPVIFKYFEKCSTKCNQSILSTLLVQDYLRICKSNNVKPTETKLTTDKFIQLVNLVDSKKIDILQAKGALETLALVWEGNVADIFSIRRFILLDMHDTKLLVDEFIDNSPTKLLNLVTNKNTYIKTIIYEVNRMKQGIANPKLIIEYCNKLVEKLAK